jgi:hypothetical protein
MCNTNLCNSNSNPAHSVRARQLFAQSMRSLDFIFPFDNSSRVSSSRIAVSSSADDDDFTSENAASGVQPQRARGGKQRRLQCYTCGSLFNRDTPPCEKFDPTNSSQITTCRKEIFDTTLIDTNSSSFICFSHCKVCPVLTVCFSVGRDVCLPYNWSRLRGTLQRFHIMNGRKGESSCYCSFLLSQSSCSCSFLLSQSSCYCSSLRAFAPAPFSFL